MRKTHFRILLLILVLFPSMLFAVDDDRMEETYVLGNRTFSINLGAGVPLFFQDFDGKSYSANLDLGMHGSLEMDFFLNNYFRTGISIGGMISGGPNDDNLYMVPIVWENIYELRRYPFLIPLSLGIGMNVSQYKDITQKDLIVKPGLGAYYYINSEWAFGLDLDYWWVPQIYNRDDISNDQSRIGNFLGVTIGALYHF
ncbi:TP0733 family outer membrane beta-barrel protein [Spirochaeta cellobiosiphila]|uniref:TP0733 family outer membrane beta-barrel protein n=1 Tax=Spirochaeta cellobiosiphila TaxID=504483 RepID=UPI000417A773|nr:hypothetical protein [Spirochaeta cellobiosiphila]